MSKQITCPSGMKLTIRGMKAKEMVHLQDRKLAKNGTVIDKLLAACIESTDDFGPYEEADSGFVSLDTMLLGDKFYTLIMVRAATFGDVLKLQTDCKNSSCEKPYDVAIKLSELPIKSLSEEDAERVRAGELMTCQVPSTGQTVKYRPASGRDEKLAAKAQDDENPALAIVACRIVEIEGVETKEQYGARMLLKAQAAGNADKIREPFVGVRGFLDDLPLDDFYALAEAMEQHDCGVETKIEAECPACSYKQEERLKLGANFWKPTKV